MTSCYYLSLVIAVSRALGVEEGERLTFSQDSESGNGLLKGDFSKEELIKVYSELRKAFPEFPPGSSIFTVDKGDKASIEFQIIGCGRGQCSCPDLSQSPAMAKMKITFAP